MILRLKRVECGIALSPLFLYNFRQKGENRMYDNDEMLLALDDDLFPVEEETEASEK